MTDDYRLPPHDIEAEEATLAAAMLSQDLAPILVSIVTPADFFREKNADVWDVVSRLVDKGNTVNQITVAAELAKTNVLESVGGQAYLADIIRKLPTFIGAEFYAEAVKTASARRKMLDLGSYLSRSAYEASAPPQSVLEHTYKALDGITGDTDDGTEWRTPDDIFKGGYVTLLHQRIEDPSVITGLPTGIMELDRKLGGLKGGLVYLVAAKTSGGKSIFIADSVRRMDENRHAIFTTEMSDEEWVDRIVYQMARVDKEEVALLGKGYSEQQIERLNDALKQLERRPVYFNDASDLTHRYVKSSMKKLMSRQKIEVAWLDHIDTMVGDVNTFNRTAIMSDITRSFKNFARANKIPLVYTSQLNRKDGSADLNSSLRDSGTKEQDADCIMFLIPVNPTTNEELGMDEARARASDPGWSKVKVVITKNRGGTTGTVDLYCDYRHGGRWGAWSKAPMQWKVPIPQG